MSQPPYPQQPQGYPQNPPPAYLSGGAVGAPAAGRLHLPPPPANKPRTVGAIMIAVTALVLVAFPLVVLLLSQAD